MSKVAVLQVSEPPHLHSEQPAAAVEAAILFSAGHDASAVQVLEAEIAARAGADKTKAWVMLLEIHHIRGDRPAFESAAHRYAEAMGSSAPSWSLLERPVSAPGMFRLEGTIGRKDDLGKLIEHAKTRKMLGIDMGQVERIRFPFAPEFCGLLHTYSYQGKRIILANIRETHAQLLDVVGGIAQIVLLRPRVSSQTRIAVRQAA